MQMILNSARIARASSNSASASEVRHISAAKPQAFVNEWRAPQPRFEALILTAPKAIIGQLPPIAMMAAKPYIQAHSRLSLTLQFRPNSLFPGTRKIRI
jgi:hypothetical protein